MFRAATSAPKVAAVLIAVSAGMHGALVPEHLAEMPNTGRLFIASAVAGIACALWLLLRPSKTAKLAAAAWLVGNLIAYVLWLTLPIPLVPGTPEAFEPIAGVCKGVELAALVALIL